MSGSSMNICDECETVVHCTVHGCIPKVAQSRPAPSKARDIQIGGDHYKNMGVEPWDVVDTWPIEQRIGFYRGGALKYVMRMGTKDENAQEIRKGAHYLQKLAEVLEQRDAEIKHSLDEGCQGA